MKAVFFLVAGNVDFQKAGDGGVLFAPLATEVLHECEAVDRVDQVDQRYRAGHFISLKMAH